MKPEQEKSISRWPFRTGMLLVLIVFPLIWAGGLVTSADAGMAVPDWPGTYGYNMLAYPIETWLTGPFDLFVEHGHRLLGMLAGIVAIALVIVTWKQESRTPVKWMSVIILVLVCLQGLLGGFRVRLDARTFAKIHGCLGPAFFAVSVAFCVVTSRWWRTSHRGTMIDAAIDSGRFDSAALQSQRVPKSSTRQWIFQWPVLIFALSFTQLVIGAFLRHIAIGSPPDVYKWLVVAHISMAVLIVAGTMIQWVAVRTGLIRFARGLRRTSNLLVLVIGIQFCLGLLTWVMKYGWPVWFENMPFAAAFVVPEKTFLQINLITAHQATGSLILALWTIHMLSYNRLCFGIPPRSGTSGCRVPAAEELPQTTDQPSVPTATAGAP